MDKIHQHDVVVLGSGLGGTLLGSILARHGLDVLLLDAGTHPRFAIGEATTPDISFRLKNLASKYDVPEIHNLSTFHKLRDHVSAACGVKRAFSFLFHREGEEQDPKESHQYPTLAAPMGPDCHFFRQDTDSYMLAVAMDYGCSYRQQTRVQEIEFNNGHVDMVSDKGEKFRAKYLVDAAGFRSPLADKFELREPQDVYRTNSRTIFTHMLGVKLYDQVGAEPSSYGLKYPVSQGTLHHVFKGGWFWIIPFNNHVDAVNPLCSVGVVLDRSVYPETGMDAEEEFFKFVNMHPAIARQFEGARAARGWVSTGRMQYLAKNLVANRYCLLAHAGGFIDPLFSSGLNLTASTVDMLTSRLLESFASGDFSVEKYERLNEIFQGNIRHYDEVIASAFLSFDDFELWDSWYRLWVVALLAATAMNANLYLKYLESGDRSVYKNGEMKPYTGSLASHFEPYRSQLYDRAFAEMEKYRAGEQDAKQTATTIRALYKDMTYFPSYFHWSDPSVRSTPAFTVWGMTRMYFWYYFKAPKEVREKLFDWSPLTAYRYILRSIWENRNLSKRRSRLFVRDVFKAWNRDWAAQMKKG